MCCRRDCSTQHARKSGDQGGVILKSKGWEAECNPQILLHPSHPCATSKGALTSHFLGHLSTCNSLNTALCTHRHMTMLEEPVHAVLENLIVKALIRKLDGNQTPPQLISFCASLTAPLWTLLAAKHAMDCRQHCSRTHGERESETRTAVLDDGAGPGSHASTRA